MVIVVRRCHHYGFDDDRYRFSTSVTTFKEKMSTPVHLPASWAIGPRTGRAQRCYRARVAGDALMPGQVTPQRFHRPAYKQQVCRDHAGSLRIRAVPLSYEQILAIAEMEGIWTLKRLANLSSHRSLCTIIPRDPSIQTTPI